LKKRVKALQRFSEEAHRQKAFVLTGKFVLRKKICPQLKKAAIKIIGCSAEMV